MIENVLENLWKVFPSQLASKAHSGWIFAFPRLNLFFPPSAKLCPPKAEITRHPQAAQMQHNPSLKSLKWKIQKIKKDKKLRWKLREIFSDYYGTTEKRQTGNINNRFRFHSKMHFLIFNISERCVCSKHPSPSHQQQQHRQTVWGISHDKFTER